MGGRVVGVVGVAPRTPNFILLLVILIYTSPPNFIEIGPKLTKFAIGVVGTILLISKETVKSQISQYPCMQI